MIARCQIELPAGSQVLLDRAPTYTDLECETPKGRLSMFPDVLLPPSKFTIVSVQRYTAGAEQEDTPRRLSPTSVWSQQEYSKYILENNDVFVDIQLRLEASWKLPEKMSV
jgi:hypothetical protein